MEEEAAEACAPVVFPPPPPTDEAGAALDALSLTGSGLGAAGWEANRLLARLSDAKEEEEGGGAVGVLVR